MSIGPIGTRPSVLSPSQRFGVPFYIEPSTGKPAENAERLAQLIAEELEHVPGAGQIEINRRVGGVEGPNRLVSSDLTLIRERAFLDTLPKDTTFLKVSVVPKKIPNELRAFVRAIKTWPSLGAHEESLPKPKPDVMPELSEDELKVLMAMDTVRQNAKLKIKAGIKTIGILSNIKSTLYKKLGVHNHKDALAQARAWGLLPEAGETKA
jgi:hypothetical protein